MKTEIYVQARMGSTRLPGKVLKPVLGKPLLFYLMERLQCSKEADAIVVATTTLPQDDIIVEFCKKNKFIVFRGNPEDVLERYYKAAEERKPDAVVRINGDCPLIDPEVVDEVIRTYKKGIPNWDYVSNTIERTFPRGMDTEIFSYEALEKDYKEAKEPDEREHVTLYMYRHPEFFRLHNVACKPNASEHRWTVDTGEDFELIRRIIEALYPKNPHFTMKDILTLLKKHPEWSQINVHIQQKSTNKLF